MTDSSWDFEVVRVDLDGLGIDAGQRLGMVIAQPEYELNPDAAVPFRISDESREAQKDLIEKAFKIRAAENQQRNVPIPFVLFPEASIPVSDPDGLDCLRQEMEQVQEDVIFIGGLEGLSPQEAQGVADRFVLGVDAARPVFAAGAFVNVCVIAVKPANGRLGWHFQAKLRHPGTSAQPWKSLGKAQAVVQAGDTVILRTGNYGAFSLTNYSNTKWITYQAAEGHSPVFSKIYIYNTAANDVYLKFDGIDVIDSRALPDPNNPPWPGLFCVRFTLANYIEVKNAYIAGINKYLAGLGVMVDNSDHITIEDSEITAVKDGIMATTSDNLTIRHNHIHGWVATGLNIMGATTGILIESNHIHDGHSNQSDTYDPPDTLYLDPKVYPQGSPPALIVGEEVRQNGSRRYLWGGGKRTKRFCPMSGYYHGHRSRRLLYRCPLQPEREIQLHKREDAFCIASF